MRFEEDASESIVFVVPERSPAPNVLYLSSGMPKASSEKLNYAYKSLEDRPQVSLGTFSQDSGLTGKVSEGS